jgi:hypothetical protein
MQYRVCPSGSGGIGWTDQAILSEEFGAFRIAFQDFERFIANLLLVQAHAAR